MQRFHAQNHTRQRGSQNFRICEFRPCVEVGLIVESNANAVGNPSATTRTLIGGCLADGFHHQLFNLAAKAVALNACGACINDVTNARNCQRGFCHIGRQHNATSRMVVKDPILISLRQTCEQRQNLGISRDRVVRQMFAQVVGRFTNFTLTGQKDQNIA